MFAWCRGVDWIRLFRFAAVLAIAILAAVLGQPFVHGNDEARGVIVNTFSILAGFLITVLTLLGDPGLYRGRTWRSDAVRRSNAYNRLSRHKWMFITYLAVLGLVFLTAVFAKRDPDGLLVLWIERGYVFLATIAFGLSLMLPGSFMSLQLTRFDEMIEARKSGVKPPEDG